MELTERTVSSQTIFRGRIIRVDMDQVELPDGKTADREVVYHPGGVAVLALDRDNSVSLVRPVPLPHPAGAAGTARGQAGPRGGGGPSAGGKAGVERGDGAGG